MYQYRFSVIIPTFRRPTQLKRALESVMAQSYKNFEIIVVNDDKNSDEVNKVVDCYNSKAISLLQNIRTKGAHGARNTGIIAAKNDYIAFLDDDDEWKEDHLLTINDFLSENPLFPATLSSHVIKENTLSRVVVHKKELLTLETFLSQNISINAGSSFCCLKSFLLSTGLFDEKMKREEDFDLLARILKITPVALLKSPTAIIHGHNEPTLDIQHETRSYLFSKLEAENIDKKFLRPFKSRHYYELASFAFHKKMFIRGFKFTFRAFYNGLLNPLSYIKLCVVFFDTAFNLQIENKLKKIIYR